MMNHIVVIGRLTGNPVARQTRNGDPVCSFSVACERNYRSQDGSRPVDYIDVVAYRATADFANKYLEKGRMVAVEGRLQIRDWTGNDGIKRRNAEIQASSISLADSRPRQEQDRQPAGSRAPAPEYAA